MTGPSEKAIEAAADSLQATAGIWSISHAGGVRLLTLNAAVASESALAAAHDPALGLDRSVCLRDVVETLRRHMLEGGGFEAEAILEREFGGA